MVRPERLVHGKRAKALVRILVAAGDACDMRPQDDRDPNTRILRGLRDLGVGKEEREAILAAWGKAGE